MKNLLRKSLGGGLIVFVLTAVQYISMFLTQVLLAREIDPEYFGEFAFCLIIVTFTANIFNTHGDKYLIKSEGDIQNKMNTIFSVEILAILTIGIPIILMVPTLMSLLKKPNQIIYVQVLMLLVLHTPFSKIKGLFERELFFFKARFPVMLSNILGGIIAISMAFEGYEIWSLIIWKISVNLIEVIILYIISPYRPKFTFEFLYFKEISSYGLPILGASLVSLVHLNFGYYLIDNLLGVRQLGYYWFAYQVTNHFLIIKTAINSVLFPIFSRIKNDSKKNKAFKLITQITGSLYLILAIIVLFWGELLITSILGINWLPSVVPFQLSFVLLLIKGIGGSSGPLLYSAGQTNADLFLSIVNLLLMIPFVLIGTIYFGIVGTVLANIVATTLLGVIGFEKFIKPITSNGFNFYFNDHLIALGFSIIIFIVGNYFAVNNIVKIFLFLSVIFILFKYHFLSVWKNFNKMSQFKTV